MTFREAFRGELGKGSVRGTFLTVGHPTIAEVVAHLDFNMIVLDLEHRAITIETAENLIRAIEAVGNDVATVIRVPEGTNAWVKRALDTGTHGVLVPMVESEQGARDVAAAGKYPPDGKRGVGASRATGFGNSFDNYVAGANDSTAVIAQVETREGIDSVEQIASVDGVDSLFVGPADLRSSLFGVASEPGELFDTAVERALQASRTEECPIGTYVGDPSTITERVEQGFDYVVAGTDLGYLKSGAEKYTTELRDAMSDRPS